ncbi:hypothetical protein [Tepidibacillus sp. HK-1]|uniref:hypothetical protein n=1 Tax=Tepidibacillus sp. HK-1 TaxID=1883407 RepID=UPI000853CF5D|nr:hypothetical protein [Tepidibacillus sp. HK-1]GBF11473.1 hypothetical protein HK1_01504 [Tepidibacillus sp. HK-1]
MMKTSNMVASLLMMLMLVATFIPTNVNAYSYGSPNEDAIASAYTDMLAALSKEPKDFAAVQNKLNEIKPEMVKEFGQEQVDRIQKGIDDKDANLVIYEMKVVIVRNIERRFINMGEIFDDYAQAKVLLAKAFANYEALSPEVIKADPELDQKIRNAFDEALASLGNPGLFGVGKVSSDRAKFDSNRDLILNEIKDFFQTEAGYQGHTKGTGQTDIEVKGGTTTWANWVPLLIILFVIVGALLLFTRKGKKRTK